MPNILLTTYCNLKCPYCFADKTIKQQEQKNITIDEYKKILLWLSNGIDINDRIGLIGGEPTLHPQIKEILNITHDFYINQGIPSIIFTNGIYLNQIINNIPDEMRVLVNVNYFEDCASQKAKSFQTSLDAMHKLQWFNTKNNKVTLGCNICLELDDYSFFWDIVDKYSPLKKVRVSVASPTNFSVIPEKEKYFISLKEKFLNFVKNASERNILIELDCSQIPICYFTETELQLIKNNSITRYNFCAFPVDITPDFKAKPCFGISELIDCQQFNNFRELYKYMTFKLIVPLTLKNNEGRCQTCSQHQLIKCQGGCLAFAQKQR